MEKIYKMKEIYWVDFEGKDSVQSGMRPAVIVQNDKGNYYSNTIVVVPITSAVKTKLPTHVHIKAGSFGLVKDSIVQCEGERVVSKNDIKGYIGHVDDDTMRDIAVACLINTPFLSYLKNSDISKMLKGKSLLKKRIKMS